jgi:mono/diheme cytochrome c family protein
LGALGAALAAAVAALVLAPLPPSPPGPEPGRGLYQAHCASCHAPDGRGRSWRARLLFLRPGDLATPAAAARPDGYLADLVRHGGATYGKPGMPAFGFLLREEEIRAVVGYLRVLAAPPPPPRAGTS